MPGTELSALYRLFNNILHIINFLESVSSTLYCYWLSSFIWSITVPCVILFFQNPLVTNHCLQVICQTLWYGDVRDSPWPVPPYFQPHFVPILPPAVLKPTYGLLFLCIHFLCFFCSYKFSLTSFLCLVTLCLESGLQCHLCEAFHNTYYQAESIVLCLSTTVPYAYNAIIPLRYITMIIFLFKLSDFWIVYTFTWFKLQ